MRGVNDAQVLDLVERFRGTRHVVRFIEYMDVGTCNDWQRDLVVPSAELRERIAARWPLRRARSELSRRSRGALRVRRRRRRDRLHQLGQRAVLRRLLARAAVGRRTLYTCLFAQRGPRPARAAARRRERRRARAASSARSGARATTATASERSELRAPAPRASKCTRSAAERWRDRSSRTSIPPGGRAWSMSARRRRRSAKRPPKRACAFRPTSRRRCARRACARRRARSSTPRSSPARWRSSARTS